MIVQSRSSTHGSKPMIAAAIFVAISAALHVVTAFSMGSLMFVVAAVYFAFAYGLYRNMRWLAYIVFAVLLAGAVTAFAISGPVMTLILLANLGCVISLFIALWRTA